MKLFLIVSLFISMSTAWAEQISLQNINDVKLNSLFGQLGQASEDPQATAKAVNALLGLMAPQIKALQDYTGVFTASCAVFFGNTVEQANCTITATNPRDLTPGAEFVAQKQLPLQYQTQITQSHIVLATVYADWRQPRKFQEFNSDLFFKQKTCTQTISLEASLSALLSPSRTQSQSLTHTSSLSSLISSTVSVTRLLSQTRTLGLPGTSSTSVSPTQTSGLPVTPTKSFSDPVSNTVSATKPLPQTQTLSLPITSTQSSSLPLPQTESLSVESSKTVSGSVSQSSSQTLCTVPAAPPTTGLLSAWSKTGGTYADGTNQPSRYIVSGSVVTDTLTNIQWERAVNTTGMTWAAASAYCAARTTGGLCGWRVPNIGELQTLLDYTVDYTVAVPVNAAAFPAAPAANLWSASSVIGALTNSWSIFFSSDSESWYDPVGTADRVRCVRSGYSFPPSSRYTANLGEVTDSVTGLIWQQSETSGATKTQASAITHCSTLGLNSHIWRLPTVKELATLIDYSKAQNTNTMDGALFSGGVGVFWSSTLLASNPSKAWYINFLYADVNYYSKLNPARARCVR